MIERSFLGLAHRRLTTHLGSVSSTPTSPMPSSPPSWPSGARSSSWSSSTTEFSGHSCYMKDTLVASVSTYKWTLFAISLLIFRESYPARHKIHCMYLNILNHVISHFFEKISNFLCKYFAQCLVCFMPRLRRGWYWLSRVGSPCIYLLLPPPPLGIGAQSSRLWRDRCFFHQPVWATTCFPADKYFPIHCSST